MKNENSIAKKILNVLIRRKAVAFIIVIIAIMPFVNSMFFSAYNFSDLLRAATVYELCACGVTLTMVAGGCDLSVGHNMTLAGILVIMLQPYFPLFVCILIALAVGSLVGVLNGYLSVYWKTEPFIITLGIDFLLKGICLYITNATPVSGTNMAYVDFGNNSFLGIPIIAYVMFAVIIACHILLRYTEYGRNLYAIGGNYNVAVYSGISVIRTKWITFIISGFTAALAGVVLSARMNTGNSVYGDLTALTVNCGAVVGGTSFAGGRGGIIESVIGIFLFSLLENCMNMANITAYIQQLVKGVLIVGILAIDCYEQKRSAEKV